MSFLFCDFSSLCHKPTPASLIEIEGYHSSELQGCKMGVVRNLGPARQRFCAFPIFFYDFFFCCNHVVFFPSVSQVAPLEVCKWTPCWALCKLERSRWCSPPVQSASLCQLTCSSLTAPVLAPKILKSLSFIVEGRKRVSSLMLNTPAEAWMRLGMIVSDAK